MYHKCVARARIDELHLHMSLLDLVNLDLAHPPGNVTFDGEGNDGDSRPVELVLHGDVEQLVVAQGLRRVAAGRCGGLRRQGSSGTRTNYWCAARAIAPGSSSPARGAESSAGKAVQDPAAAGIASERRHAGERRGGRGRGGDTGRSGGYGCGERRRCRRRCGRSLRGSEAAAEKNIIVFGSDQRATLGSPRPQV